MKFIACLVLFASAGAWAGQSNVEKSQCRKLRTIDQQHQAWKKDFAQFTANEYDWDSETRFHKMAESLDQLVDWMNSVQATASDEKIIQEANRLRHSIDKGEITNFEASAKLKPNLPKLSNQLAKMLSDARRAIPDCDSSASVATVTKTSPDAAN